MEHAEHHQSVAKTWIVVILLLMWIFFKGGLAYFMIGDRGMPDWDYRPIRDVPGESYFAIYDPLPYIQHVRAPNSESWEPIPHHSMSGVEKVNK